MMKDQADNKTASSQFLKTDGGKTKPNAIEVPSISLQKGGGAIKGIDEKFSVNAVNGTASFSVPLPFSPARGASPGLSLSYNSGTGNGIFGLGWNLSLSSIKRKTDKELPKYLDDIGSDTFLFSEAEDLVPEFKRDTGGNLMLDDGEYLINEKNSRDGLFLIRFYKPRIEGLFARIERWTEKITGRIKWRIITKENSTTLFGWTDNSIISNPDNPKQIYEWLPEFVFDDKGNCAQYIYKKEDEIGFDELLLHNRNRLKNGLITYTNIYIDKILYGNKTPYEQIGDAFPGVTDYMFQTVFDYGTLLNNDSYETINDWDFRPDAFSDYKSGFETRTTRLCKRVLLFHVFDELALKPDKSDRKTLIRSINFDYDTSAEHDFTFLKTITSYGYIKKPDGSYSHKKLPPTEFEYQKHDWNKEVKTIATGDLVHAPVGFDDGQYLFTDLFNEGLSGILTEQANGWYYKHNLGNGHFEQAKPVSPKPSFAGLGDQLQLIDLDADGGKQLASINSEPKGFFELDEENEWQSFRNFENLPNINLRDPNTRMLDLNGDGKADVLITDDNVFTWYESSGRKGFAESHKNFQPFDEEAGPHVIFADPLQTIFLADMSGNGMVDIVRIRNGEICYWPNLGYGKFGAKVAMDNAPVFDHPDAFNPAYIRLADIDGSGTADIIYLGKNRFTCWMNLSGNSFGTMPFETDAFPEIHDQAQVSVIDLLGNGVACIVWSGILSKDAQTPLKYIDLMNSRKPHVMVSYRNNLGKEVTLEYTPSTQFYIEDKLAGRPWVTKLHFPVHCISKTETADKISGWRFVSSYKYHHGYYDHPEREFRGFGMVEQTDAETFEHWIKKDAANITEQELHQDPVITKQWFHTGAFSGKERILNQFAHEYWYEEIARAGFPVVNVESQLPDARLIVAPGLDTSLVDHLSGQEWQEALRACKSMALRSEVFAKDAPLTGATTEQLHKELTPYSVATHNCVIELLQPKGQNKHAIFVVKESEAITYSYERDTTDPRIAHHFNIRLDEYGNVLESAAVVYPRLIADTSLPVETQEAQNRTTIIYAQNQFTNDVIDDDVYRLRLQSEARTYEVKVGTPVIGIYSIAGIMNRFATAGEVPYEHFAINPVAHTSQKRLTEHIRSIYLSNDLQTPLVMGNLESLAIPYQNYQLAYTPSLLNDIFGGKIADPDTLMAEGRFDHSESDNNWWIRSGTTQFMEGAETVSNARDRFCLPVSYTDPYGTVTKVKYFSHYFLFIAETEDAVGNKASVDLFNFRTLSPQRMRDPNNNLSEAITDELGLVKAMAVFGKGDEADDLTCLTEYTEQAEKDLVNDFFNTPETPEEVDNTVLPANNAKLLLQHATARFVYDFEGYKTTGRPAAVASIVREEHFQKNNNSPVQISFEYSNGLGKVVMKKVQAEPGLAKQVTVNTDNTYSVSEINTASLHPKQLRWIGNGRTILNNKGNPVKQYEPYFSVTPHYEDFRELVETGVTPVMYYDAMGRLIKTEMPDGTFSKTGFDSWKQIIFDQNDTVKESRWYADRGSPDPDNEPEPQFNPGRRSAWLAAKHAGTPNVRHFDTLGRPVLSVDHNRNTLTNADEYYLTKVFPDTEGNLRSVTDARGNIVMQYKYDMLGNLVYQDSMDAGKRWLLINILGNPLRTWDERDHEFQYFYDILHRPVQSKVLRGDGLTPLDHIFNRVEYGESQTNPELKNLRGQVLRNYDTGGLLEMPGYDFKGQPNSTTRRLFSKYKEVANWADTNLLSDLETEVFTFTTETDALGRITRQTAPDGSVITPSYNEAGLLDGENVFHPGAANASVYIKDIDYNEKGQRTKIIYGNDVYANFYFDRETFRLMRLESKRKSGDPMQDWHYTFDPVGNITQIEDRNIPVKFFDNQKITGVSEYAYDALYRLVKATGRENDAALTFGTNDNWNDAPFMHEINPGISMAGRNYTQNYNYDEAGNIMLMKHVANGGSWTRTYEYETVNNRLRNTKVGQGANTLTYSYPHHDRHGFITAMPHLEEMGWNFKEELVKTIRQKVNTGNGTAETTYYQYDGSGQRIRKITENIAHAGTEPTKKEERIYITGYETYRTCKANIINFERESLSLMDQGYRFVMVETVKQNTDATPPPSERVGERLVRYQLHNHLGSACLELDETAQIISYEEYHPYGTTAYQALNAAIKSTAKRYRYTGMERDEETGLEYHSARYYMPWLGRWVNSDPSGFKDGLNLYLYVHSDPIGLYDPTGNGPAGPPLSYFMDPALPNALAEELPYLGTWFKNMSKGVFRKVVSAVEQSPIPQIGEAVGSAIKGEFGDAAKHLLNANPVVKMVTLPFDTAETLYNFPGQVKAAIIEPDDEKAAILAVDPVVTAMSFAAIVLGAVEGLRAEPSPAMDGTPPTLKSQGMPESGNISGEPKANLLIQSASDPVNTTNAQSDPLVNWNGEDTLVSLGNKGTRTISQKSQEWTLNIETAPDDPGATLLDRGPDSRFPYLDSEGDYIGPTLRLDDPPPSSGSATTNRWYSGPCPGFTKGTDPVPQVPDPVSQISNLWSEVTSWVHSSFKK